MSSSLTFLGAAGTVTGSRYLIDSKAGRVLVDCGLFQGLKNLRLRNWNPFPTDPASISSVVLTHAHLDHSGYLPALVRDGFDGSIYASAATLDYCGIILPDSARLQEQDAAYASRKGFSKHKPPKPLYETADADAALERFVAVPFDELFEIPGGLTIRLSRAGHILGAASVELWAPGAKLVFSGDLGRYGDPIMPDPSRVEEADLLVVESTYGNRRHDASDPEEVLGAIIERTVKRGGTVVIPSFAVGRAQTLLYHLERLKAAGRIPNVPIYLNSPMATDASDILCGHIEDQRLSSDQCRRACHVATYVRSVEESKALNENAMPKVIISASGMLTGGRVLHHLKRFGPDVRSTIVLAGYQAAGTRGASLLAGAKEVKLHGEYVPVRAEVVDLPMLSAHADTDEIMRWLAGFVRPPRMTYITHGEPEASEALRRRIQDELGWSCQAPEPLQRVAL
jgi:metallo-beta-lactamase family protein